MWKRKKITYHNSSVTALKAQVWTVLACSTKHIVPVPSHRRFTSNGGQGADRFHLTSTWGPSPLVRDKKKIHNLAAWDRKENTVWSNWQCQDSESLAVSLPQPRTEHDAGGLVKCAHFTHHFTWGAHTGVCRSTWHIGGPFGRHKVSAGTVALLSWISWRNMQNRVEITLQDVCGLG